MYLAEGATHYQPISWDRALTLVADRLRAMPDPNRAAFYTSGRASNEAAFMYQPFARKLGTNNLPDCSNMCHESSGLALSQTIGIGKGTVSLEDIADHAEGVESDRDPARTRRRLTPRFGEVVRSQRAEPPPIASKPMSSDGAEWVIAPTAR
jgi:NADH dehydrogenase/NADH:ubiquinone oxidoreductase subunit G